LPLLLAAAAADATSWGGQPWWGKGGTEGLGKNCLATAAADFKFWGKSRCMLIYCDV
jgi:hypothetical protein